MKLTAKERAAVKAGDRSISRNTRTRKSGRELGCSIKVGDAIDVDGLYLAVCSVVKVRRATGNHWLIRFEEVGSWAIPDAGEEILQMSRTELEASLPEKLAWDTEPGTRAGDLFVFEWGQNVWVNPETGERHESAFPALYLVVTSNPVRNLKKGHWWASFETVGFEKDEYMRHTAGTTTNPVESLDPEASLAVVESTMTDREVAEAQREQRRREIPRADDRARFQRMRGKLDDAA